MSKIYIDPLNLGPVLIDTKDFSQCEVDNVKPWPWGFKKGVPHKKSHCKRISKALKGKKAGAGQIAATKAAAKVNKGKKRPEHSKLMKERYEKGECKPPVGMAKGKRSKKSRKNMSDSIAKLRKKIVSCIKCHKPTDGSMFEGAWMCHFANHHRSC